MHQGTEIIIIDYYVFFVMVTLSGFSLFISTFFSFWLQEAVLHRLEEENANLERQMQEERKKLQERLQVTEEHKEELQQQVKITVAFSQSANFSLYKIQS